jgi:16S rRNA (cytidine1402-2'-O)-methyltransferase
LKETGKIYLIPVPIDDAGLETIPKSTLEILFQLSHFVVERSKTARKFIKLLGHPLPQSELRVTEMPKHGKIDFEEVLDIVKAGHDIGIMSESGCPGIADPGAEIASWAHLKDIQVVPMVGPSSLLLALMASGFSGQSFVFHGYLPADKEELVKKLRLLEVHANKLGQTQIFIETPYRNKKMFEAAMNTLLPESKLSVHMGLTGPNAFSMTKTIKEWKLLKGIFLRDDVPAVFIIG